MNEMQQVAHPCVDKSSGDREDRIYHKYYQWVYFVLFFQAACFYAPHFFWKMYEGQLLSKLTSNFRNPLFREEEEKGKESAERGSMKLVVNYLAKNRSRHRNYFYYFIVCELCNFINVILQIYLVDEFLGGTFTTYGLDVLNYVQLEQDDRIDPMVRVFPRMTKCTFHRFGASGDVQKYDALCILPLNIINEKIYIIMWFWFVFLAFVTGVWLVYRFLTFSQARVRYQVLRRRASLTKGRHLRYLSDTIDAGDWFLLSMMCKNMDAQWFRILSTGLFQKLHSLEPQQGGRGRRSRARGSDAKFRGVRGDGKQRILDDPESGERDFGGSDEDDNISLEEVNDSKPLQEITSAPTATEGSSK